MAPIPIMIAASAIGAGIQAFGQYQSGQAQSRAFQYQAGVSTALAGIAARNANYDIVSGEVKAQQAGLVGAANVARTNVRSAAGNVAINTGSTTAVRGSELAISAENQAVQRADAAHAAYGEEIQAAEKTATAGAQTLAAHTAVTSGDISALGSVVSGVGSVASKWYGASIYGPGGGGNAPTPNYPLSGPVTPNFLEEN